MFHPQTLPDFAAAAARTWSLNELRRGTEGCKHGGRVAAGVSVSVVAAHCRTMSFEATSERFLGESLEKLLKACKVTEGDWIDAKPRKMRWYDYFQKVATVGGFLKGVLAALTQIANREALLGFKWSR